MLMGLLKSAFIYHNSVLQTNLFTIALSYLQILSFSHICASGFKVLAALINRVHIL